MVVLLECEAVSAQGLYLGRLPGRAGARMRRVSGGRPVRVWPLLRPEGIAGHQFAPCSGECRVPCLRGGERRGRAEGGGLPQALSWS